MRHAPDEMVHTKPEYEARCPYCHPELVRSRVFTQGEAEQVRLYYGIPEAPPVMPQPLPQLTVEQRMAQLRAQYEQQVAQVSNLAGVSRSGLYAALQGKRR